MHTAADGTALDECKEWVLVIHSLNVDLNSLTVIHRGIATFCQPYYLNLLSHQANFEDWKPI